MKNYNFEWRILEHLNKGEYAAETMRLFLEELSAEMSAAAASLWLLDENGKINLYAACGDNCEGLDTIVLEPGKGICGCCIAENEMIVSESASNDARWNPDADQKTGFHTQGILAAPISDGSGNVFGCLELLNKQGGPFEEADKELAKIMAHLLAKWFFEHKLQIPMRIKKDVLLDIRHLNKTFGKDAAAIKALDDVSFQIFKGEFMVILGSSGSGKSTMLNMLGGMDKPDSGQILLPNGNDICTYSKKQQCDYRKDVVGFIFQSYNLIPDLTAEENVALAAEMSKDSRTTDEVLEMMGLSKRRNHYPSQMSGGEQQRVSIARAIVKNADFLLCDEPTGALDFQTGRQLLIELESLVRNGGQTVVLVTHTASIASIADRVIKMRSGRIVETVANPFPLTAAEIEW